MNNDEQYRKTADWLNSTPGQIFLWVIVGALAVFFVWSIISDLL